MGRKSPQQFVKRQKEMERAQKAREKMAKRHQGNKNSEETEADPVSSADEPIS